MIAGRVLVISSRVAREDAPLIATPTTTAQKRMPGRTLSSYFRIISDLRYTNLFFRKADYPEVKMTDIEKIADKVIATKMRWRGIPILCTKRDIDSAFKRASVHPDMCAILCTEFSANQLGLVNGGETVIFLYLALPFG